MTKKWRLKLFARKFLSVSIAIAFAFLILCTIWYFTSYKTYDSFMNKCQVLEDWNIDDYSSGSGTDNDNWSYSVKRPNFLSWVGNLAISSYKVDENTNEVLMYTDSLIIWPKYDGTYEFGVILYEYVNDGDSISCIEHQMYIDEEGEYLSIGDSAIDNESSEILGQHRETVKLLLEKARNLWNI